MLTGQAKLRWMCIVLLLFVGLCGTASAQGLTAARNQIWTQDSEESGVSIAGHAEIGDTFGYALASGDFDKDGCMDLAVGVPTEWVSTGEYEWESEAGAVNILYGSPQGGLTAARNQLWTQEGSKELGQDILGHAEKKDMFGYALVSGDFDKDGCMDLAIGVPYEDVTVGKDKRNDAGAVTILYGSPGVGLTAAKNQLWTSEGISGRVEKEDRFGYALASGDFNKDGCMDLAIGIPYEDVTVGKDELNDAGAVTILYGSPQGGLTAARNQLWTQEGSKELGQDILGHAEKKDMFGYALVSGDFDKDGCMDLAIGVPYEDVKNDVSFGAIIDLIPDFGNGPEDGENAGAVNILYGSGDGLTALRNQFWTQYSKDKESGEEIRGRVESGDRFGYALASGDFNKDGCADLAIGVPYEEAGDVYIGEAANRYTGAVNILYGSPQ